MKIKLLALLLFAALITTGCKTEYDVFIDTAKSVAKTGGIIDNKEFAALLDEVALHSDDRKFQALCTSGKPDAAKLKKALEAENLKVVLAPVTDHSKDTINVYIENSGSMFGFVNGDTPYKDALTELLVQIGSSYGKSRVRLHFINTKIYPVNFEGNPAQYPRTLNPGEFKAVGDINNSDINDIYRQIIEKTDDKIVSVLVSDCIYSVTGDDVAGKLEIQKSLTKDAFQGNGNLTAMIMKLQSEFNGTYYTKNKTRANFIKNIRPYYITALGTDEALWYFKDAINLKDLNGYQNRLTIAPQDFSDEPYFTVVSTTTSSGFRPIRELSGAGYIHGIEDIEVSTRTTNRLTFTIAIDLSHIPAEEDIKEATASYAANGYDVTIAPYNERDIKPSSVQQIAKSGEKPTHLITFTAKNEKFTDAAIILKKQLPQWVYTTNTNDDTGLKSGDGKTFGFKYLAEGMFEASEVKSAPSSYFDITIKINQ